MLLIFSCEFGHTFKKILEIPLEDIPCQECGFMARRDSSSSKTQVDIVDKFDNGYMAKSVEYSPKRAEMLREQGDAHGKMIKKRLGYETDD